MSLKADKAQQLVEAVKEAKQKLAKASGADHEKALDELRDAEDAYQDYLYSQRP